MRFTLVAICLAAIFAIGGSANVNGEDLEVPKAELSDVTWGKVVNGVPFDKEDLAGKVVVVEEWGVNCAVCLATMPALAKMAKTNEKSGLRVIGLECQGSSTAEILRFLKAAKVTYPIMSGGSAPGGSNELPYICVFDVDGKLVFSGSPEDEAFERAVKKALKDVKSE